jgi:hypothetical protein
MGFLIEVAFAHNSQDGFSPKTSNNQSMSNNISLLRGYIKKSREIAFQSRTTQNGNLHAKTILAKMIACRLLWGLDEVHFAYYNLQNKSMRNCMEYLTKREMDALENQVNANSKIPLDDKIEFWRRAVTAGVTTPDILAVLNPENVDAGVPKGIPQVLDLAQLEAFLEGMHGRRIVFKLAAGSYGIGMTSIHVGDTLTDHLGNTMHSRELMQHCLRTLRQTGSGQKNLPSARCYVVQEHVLPHPNLRPIMPGLALGTFRIVTYRDHSGTVSIPFAFAKIPRQHSLNDNFHHGTTGNLLCGIEIQSGRLMDARGKVDSNALLIERIEEHPDSSFRFREFVVPQWQALREAATNAANAFPDFRTVGWDVALTGSGPMILEGNWHYDPDGPQITLDRGIKSDVRNLFKT